MIVRIIRLHCIIEKILYFVDDFADYLDGMDWSRLQARDIAQPTATS